MPTDTRYKPPTKVRTRQIPYRAMVLRADPQLEYMNRHQPFYEFSNGRKFTGNEKQHGVYVDTGPDFD